MIDAKSRTCRTCFWCLFVSILRPHSSSAFSVNRPRSSVISRKSFSGQSCATETLQSLPGCPCRMQGQRCKRESRSFCDAGVCSCRLPDLLLADKERCGKSSLGCHVTQIVGPSRLELSCDRPVLIGSPVLHVSAYGVPDYF